MEKKLPPVQRALKENKEHEEFLEKLIKEREFKIYEEFGDVPSENDRKGFVQRYEEHKKAQEKSACVIM